MSSICMYSIFFSLSLILFICLTSPIFSLHFSSVNASVLFDFGAPHRVDNEQSRLGPSEIA